MTREGQPQASNSAPAGGSDAREPDGSPRGRAGEREARTSSSEPRASSDRRNVPATLQDRLASLAPTRLEIRDDSAAHAGHAGAAGGAGHFSVTIVSEHFFGMTRLARHRAVLSRVGDLIPFPVHALAIHAYAPGEPVPTKG